MGLRIGVDIGGSFTDFAVLDEETQTTRTLKVFSRPDSPGSEVIAGMEGLRQHYGIDPADVVYFTHGTTVGVNAVVQRKGLRLALLTTEHFEDVLDIARLKIPDMYHLMSKRPEPLIPRERVFGVDGRLDATGTELTPVSEASVLRALAALQAAECEGVVISLLHSYRNPSHERAVKAIIERAAPGLFVCASNEIWPIIREFERTVTATIGSYVQPRVTHYLNSLQAALRDSGVHTDLKVTKSNGGVMSAESGKDNCVQMILSGTASGVIGAAYLAKISALTHCMSLDIGGTTADVALIVDGKPQYATGEYIGDFQIHIPSVSVSSIGDGGGSIAWVDALGALHVGPESAGSSPGPVCYGRGGVRPTITDAFAVIGILGRAPLGYNAVNVDVAAARAAIAPLAQQLGMETEQAAAAIIDVAVSGMYAGVSRVASRFGIDPREFTLMPFGGAGPMLGCFVAQAMNAQQLLVPMTPGVLSALGGLIADIRNDFLRTAYYPLDAAAPEKLRADLDLLETQARAWMIGEAGSDRDATLAVSADMRYRGQSYEVETPLDLDWIRNGDTAQMGAAFHREHARLFGHGDEHGQVQVVALRLVITLATPKPKMATIAQGSGSAPVDEEIQVYLDGRWRKVPLYSRHRLLAGHQINGPAVIAQSDTTTCLLSGYVASVDTYGNLMLTRTA
jgi:N-methylhydantoinase A